MADIVVAATRKALIELAAEDVPHSSPESLESTVLVAGTPETVEPMDPSHGWTFVFLTVTPTSHIANINDDLLAGIGFQVTAFVAMSRWLPAQTSTELPAFRSDFVLPKCSLLGCFHKSFLDSNLLAFVKLHFNHLPTNLPNNSFLCQRTCHQLCKHDWKVVANS